MKLLAIESATDACSVALACNDETIVDHRLAPQKHAQLLLPMIDKVLIDAGIGPADLDGIAFGCGPGSFTGVRIAAATAQGIAFGADIGVIPVSSLQALAQGVHRTQAASHVFASFDARMGEVYWGAYVADGNGVVQPVLDDCVCPPEHILIPDDAQTHQWRLAGSGADEYSNEFVATVGSKVSITIISNCWPEAQDVLRVAQPLVSAGGMLCAADALPVYLRNKVALTEAQRAAGERL